MRTESRYRNIAYRILRCLDLSEEPEFLREHVGKEAAVCLKEVLDRIDLPPENEIPEVRAPEDGEEANVLDRWTIPHTEITIVRIPEGPRQGEYLFSPETVGRATEFYRRVKRLPYKPGASEGFYEWFLSEPGAPWLAALVHRLPDWFHNRVGGQAVWQWIGLTVTGLLGLCVMLGAYVLGRRRARIARRSSILRYCVTLLFPVAALFVPLLVSDIAENELVLSGTTLVVVTFSANVVFLLAVLVVLVAVADRIAELVIASPRINPKGLNAQVIRLICRVLGLVVATIVFLEGGRYLGIPLTTLLAGAGVGGLAVALAAQDTLRNFFGTMMIFLDRPYRVGERIVVKGYDGFVEELGLRSTKIRLLNGHLVTIPNEEMAKTDVENVGRRPYIRRTQDLALAYHTPPDKVKKALEITRELLNNHEGMKPEFPPRVFFTEFARDALNLRIIYWYHPPDYWSFLAHSERFNVRLMEQFEAAGIQLELPSTKTRLVQHGEEPLSFRLAGDTDADGLPSRP
ncbi:MAG: mechanosensitive ion channel family protein, partial [Planctomycetota bacterium]|jgi:MscS family membrane protein